MTEQNESDVSIVVSTEQSEMDNCETQTNERIWDGSRWRWAVMTTTLTSVKSLGAGDSRPSA